MLVQSCPAMLACKHLPSYSPLAPAEAAQQDDHKKLSKHAKKRAREERERAIRDAELRRLQVGGRINRLPAMPSGGPR